MENEGNTLGNETTEWKIEERKEDTYMKMLAGFWGLEEAIHATWNLEPR